MDFFLLLANTLLAAESEAELRSTQLNLTQWKASSTSDIALRDAGNITAIYTSENKPRPK
jgi:hypothetical protein